MSNSKIALMGEMRAKATELEDEPEIFVMRTSDLIPDELARRLGRHAESISEDIDDIWTELTAQIGDIDECDCGCMDCDTEGSE